MVTNPEKSNNPEAEFTVYVISKCWLDEDGRILSVPMFGLYGELTDPEQVAACVAILNASEEARFGPNAKFFYHYKPYPKQLIDDFPFG